MKKRNLLFVTLVCIVIISAIVFAFSARKPFRDLQPSDIISATVQLAPPDKTIQIKEPDELVSYLQEIVIYDKDDQYNGHSGQAVILTLDMSDGTQVNIISNTSFVVIDGIGYKTKYGPCKKLNHYANELLCATSPS